MPLTSLLTLGGAQMPYNSIPCSGSPDWPCTIHPYLKPQSAKGIILTCCLTAFLGNNTEHRLSFPSVYFAGVVYPLLRNVWNRTSSISVIKDRYWLHPRDIFLTLIIFGLLYVEIHWIDLVVLGIFNYYYFILYLNSLS